MKISDAYYGMFARMWGLKDREYSSFFVNSARNELGFNRTKLNSLVLERLKKIICHAEKTSEFYAKTFSDRGVSSKQLLFASDLTRFPILTRDDLRMNLSEIISGGKVQPTWSKSATGGTTSSPVVFFCDQKALWRKYAFSKAFDGWYGKKMGDRSAYLWGALQDIPDRPTLGMRLRNITCNRSLMLPSAPLDEKIMYEHYQKLEKWRPTFLQAYPTPLYEFCLFLRRHSFSLPFLKSVSVTAETLCQEHRELIEETLGFKIYNWYGSRELGRVASECKCHDGMHINEPSVFVEIEPDPFLPEEYGHLIVTDLLNMATPLIRYRTGDIARIMEGTCPCGSVLNRISSLAGRVTDLIILQNGRKVRLTNHSNFKEIVELQVVQKTHTDFLVRYVKGSDFSSDSLSKFLESFYTLLDMRVFVSFEEVVQIPRERSGKVRLVVSELPTELVSSSHQANLGGF